MPSTFAWLDHSEEQRRKVLDVIDLFKEQGTVDELGLGTIRDAAADILFPGTGNLMTKAAYYLFVPWMYLRLEAQKTPSSEIAAKERREELRLIERLLESGETFGVIGRRARGALRRLPSSIYWAGMRRLGICLFDGSQDAYHRSLDRFYERQRMVVKTDDGERVGGGRPNWNPRLPAPPADWPKVARLALAKHEGEFLRDQVVLTAPESLFSFLARASDAPDDVEFPWAHPHYATFSDRIKWQLSHAQNFSEITNGAPLLYNLMLSELIGNQEWVDGYRAKLADWAGIVNDRMSVFERWDRRDAWACVESEGARIPLQTREFVDRWCELVLETDPNRIVDSEPARTLIRNRERRLKGHLARVDNARARELFQGASGIGRLNFRWTNADVIIHDVVSAIHETNHA